jgi:oxygen-independent coproporphyrinogen-3 oxidase
MGLRLTDGIPRAVFATALGRAPEEILDAARLARLVDGGFMVVDSAGLRATPDGRQRLNSVLGALLG